MNNSQNNLNRAKGQRAEELAKDYLIENGFIIILMNFHYGKLGEIDIIAEKDDVIVFVEVRSRTYQSSPDPIFSLNRNKIRTIRKVAEGYLFINPHIDKECRLDFIKIEFFTNPPRITHICDAF